MTAKRKKKKVRYANPDDVLSGRVAVTPLELIRLIHQINPTNSKFSSDKTSERYRLKARLQNMLIKKFNDSLIIEQSDPEHPQLIGIKLKHFDEDACHALLHELDSEARSWVQKQIDERSGSSGENSDKIPTTAGAAGVPADSLKDVSTIPVDPGSNAGERREECSPGELLGLGRKALKEYDYEAAETYFSRAFIASPGNLDMALALLEFLIDHLAAYEKVLDYSESLPILVKKDVRIKILLARALARCGKTDEALDCLGSAPQPDAAKVYLLAARHFVKSGEIERASRLQALLESFKEADLQLETEKLANDIHQLRIKNLVPLEKKMLDAQQQGESEKAVQLANRLLTEWPENKNARRIRRDFAERRRVAEKTRLLERADEARSRGDFTLEIEALKKLLAVNGNDESIAQRLAQADKAAGKKREEAEIIETLKLLDDGSDKEACMLYSGLNQKQRQRLMSETANPHFYQLEQIINAQSTLKPEKMVDAVLAFGQCREMLTRGDDPQAIISLLQDHDKILRSLPGVPELHQQAEMMSKKIKSAQVKSLLQQAGHQMAQEDLRAVHTTVDLIKVQALGENDMEHYQNITAELEHHEEIQRLKQKYADENNVGNHFVARDLAQRLATEKPNEGSLWHKKAAVHSSLIKAEWSFVKCDVKNLPRSYDLTTRKLNLSGHCNCLTADGRHLIFVSGYGRWLLVGVFCLNQQTFIKAIVFRTPKEISYPKATLINDIIWIHGDSSLALSLSLDPPDILSWHDLSDLVKDNEIIEDVLLFPKSGYMWIGVRNQEKRGDDIYNVIRLEQHRIERQIKFPLFPITITKGKHFQVLAPALGSDSSAKTLPVYSVQGRMVESLSMAPGKITDTATTHPEGSGYIVLSYIDSAVFDPFREVNADYDDDEDESNEGDDYQLTMEVLPEDKGKPISVKIDGSHGELFHAIYTLPKAGLVFVYYDNVVHQNHQLITFKFSGNQYEKLYQVNAPRGLLFATGETNQEIVAINSQKERVQVVVLGENQPEFIFESTDDFVFGRDLPSFTNFITCGQPTGPVKARALALMMLLRDSSFIKIVSMIEASKYEGGDPDEIIAFILALMKTAHLNLSDDLTSWFKKEYPDHPRNVMDLAARAINESEWQKAVSLLEGISRSNLDDGTACHICHLLGIGLFALGKVDKALQIWTEGDSLEGGDCELEPLLVYAEFSSMSTEERLEFRSNNELFASLDIYESVENCLRNEHWLTAITIMEKYNLASLHDLQILARLSDAYLHCKVRTGEPRWLGKVMVLANFHNSHKDKIIFKNQLLPPYIGNWSETRLQEMAEKAARWLEQAG